MFKIKPYKSKILPLLFFSILTFSSVLFSGLLYEEYQLAKTVSFTVFFLFIAFILLFCGIKIKLTPVLIVFLIFFYYIFSKFLFSPHNIKTNYALSLISPAVFILP